MHMLHSPLQSLAYHVLSIRALSMEAPSEIEHLFLAWSWAQSKECYYCVTKECEVRSCDHMKTSVEESVHVVMGPCGTCGASLPFIIALKCIRQV